MASRPYIMQLILMRHGVATEREEWNGDDDLRPLSPEGHEKTRDAASGLKGVLRVEPQIIASSPKTRAVQTAEFVAGIWKKTRFELWPELASNDFNLWLQKLRDTNADSVLLIGHEPDLSRFASLLLAFDADTIAIDFKKAGALGLELDLQTNRATLQWMILPRVLRLL